MTAALALSATLPPVAGAVAVFAVLGFVFAIGIVISGLRDKQKERENDSPER